MAEPLHEFKAEFFKALAHPTRIRILERLRDGEGTVGELQRVLGLDQSAVSQQLAVLRRQAIVEAEKQGATVRYRVRDETLFQLLDVARQMFNNRLTVSQDLLRALQAEDRAARIPRADAGRPRRPVRR
jgi:DNA-binding transcriptional ArsR family regulator